MLSISKNVRSLLAAALPLVAATSMAQLAPTAIPSSKTMYRTKSILCNETEKIVFSCRLENKKAVSLCSSQNLSKNMGYVIYRYGSSIRNIELSYPEIDISNQSNLNNLHEDYFRLDLSQTQNESKATIVFYIDGFGYALGTGNSYFLYDGRKKVKNYISVWDHRGVTQAIHRCIEETVVGDVSSLKSVLKKN
jgi:hypothetical protein